MEFIYSAIEYLSLVAHSIGEFIGLIGDWLHNIFAYAAKWLIVIWFDIKIATIKLSMSIARALLSDYGVYNLAQSSFNALPADVRYILNAFGFTTGLRVIFDAFATSLVMRFFGW